MGDNTLTTATDGNVIPATDNNQFKSALVGDLVPRNTSGVPEDVAGNLGTAPLNWNDGYLKKLYVDDIEAANTISLGGKLINAAGDPQINILSGSGTFTLPSDIFSCIIQVHGGGGGGGDTNSSTAGGGAGGFASCIVEFPQGGASIDYVAGTGGTRGIWPTTTVPTSGTDSYITIDSEEVMRAIGGTFGQFNTQGTGGAYKIRQFSNSVNYTAFSFQWNKGGNGGSQLPEFPTYTTGGSPTIKGGGASSNGNGGNEAAGVYSGNGGGAGFYDGGNGGLFDVRDGGNGGDGAVVIIYFKDV